MQLRSVRLDSSRSGGAAVLPVEIFGAKALVASAQVVGFYSYGELSPIASGNCDLHNQTMTLTTICER